MKYSWQAFFILLFMTAQHDAVVIGCAVTFLCFYYAQHENHGRGFGAEFVLLGFYKKEKLPVGRPSIL